MINLGLSLLNMKSTKFEQIYCPSRQMQGTALIIAKARKMEKLKITEFMNFEHLWSVP